MVLVHFVTVLLVILGAESVFESSKRNISTDFFCGFIQNSQTVFDYELYSLLRKIIHLFSADPEEGLPAQLVETLQPGLFSFKEAKAGSLLPGQKLLQGDRVAVGIAKVPVSLAIDCRFSCRGLYCNHYSNAF